MSNYAERIRQAIEHSGKTQRQIADEIGVTEVSMSRYVSGQRIPRAKTLVNIAKVCNVSEMWLITGKETMSKHVEMIIDYTVNGDDFQYNDNHGVLIRCGNCRYADGKHRRCMAHGGLTGELAEDDYCSKAVKA